jgi:hypothetical protein
VQRLARSFSEEALRSLLALMRSPEMHGNVRIKAVEAVLSRGPGLPTVAPDITVQKLLARRLVGLNIDELRSIELHLANAAIDVTPTESSTDS